MRGKKDALPHLRVGYLPASDTGRCRNLSTALFVALTFTSMDPPAKRVRLTDDSPAANASADAHFLEDALRAGRSSISNLKHHDVLWYEDGSIILATDVHLYCVHKSFLASSSTVFKDMLAMPSADSEGIAVGSSQEMHMGKDEDIYEGKPVVRMFGDSDENVYHLLMALYDRKCVIMLFESLRT